MPGVFHQPTLARSLSAMWRHQMGLASNQQLVISNRKGQPILCTGLQPGSNPPAWGLGLLRQNFRGRAAFFGEQEGPTTTPGTTALYFYAADGQTVLVKVTENGISVRNPSTGVMTRVSAPQSKDVGTELTTSSTTFVTLGGPAVSVSVGPSGRALVVPSAVVGIDGGASSSYWQGIVGVQVDGAGTTLELVQVSENPVSGSVNPLQVTGTNAYLWSGLSEGSHTFRCLYRSTNGQAVHFTVNSLFVIPY